MPCCVSRNDVGWLFRARASNQNASFSARCVHCSIPHIAFLCDTKNISISSYKCKYIKITEKKARTHQCSACSSAPSSCSHSCPANHRQRSELGSRRHPTSGPSTPTTSDTAIRDCDTRPPHSTPATERHLPFNQRNNTIWLHVVDNERTWWPAALHEEPSRM